MRCPPVRSSPVARRRRRASLRRRVRTCAGCRDPYSSPRWSPAPTAAPAPIDPPRTKSRRDGRSRSLPARSRQSATGFAWRWMGAAWFAQDSSIGWMRSRLACRRAWRSSLPSHNSTNTPSSRCCNAEWYSSGSMYGRSSCAETSSDRSACARSGIGCVAGDGDHLAALFAEIAADLAQRRLAPEFGKDQQHVAGTGGRHAGRHVRGVEVVHGEDAEQRQLQREGARVDVVFAQADDEHLAGVADRLRRSHRSHRAG